MERDGVQSGGARVRDLLRRADADPTGLGRAAAVFVVGAVLSVVLWYPLGIPSEIVRNLIARPTVICSFGSGPSDFFAAAAGAGTPRMYFCSWAVAILTMAGPVLLLVLAFMYRARLTRLVTAAAARLPSESRFLIAPVVSTLIFTMAWSGSHYQTSWLVGLVLPQTMFPAVIGLFTYAVGRWGGILQSRLAPLFDVRDRFPMQARIAAAIVAPIVFSFLLTAETRVSLTAQKEQLIVLFGLATGFFMLAPRRGDVLGGVSRQLATVAQRVRSEAEQRAGRARSSGR